MALKAAFAAQLSQARRRRGLTQQQVAEVVDISARWYQQLERGAMMPGATTLLRLVIFLEIDVRELREEVGLNDQIPLPTR